MSSNDLLSPEFGMTCSIIVIALFTLILMIANCCKFLRSKKLRRTLIILFYGFAFSNVLIVAISHIMGVYAIYFASQKESEAILYFTYGSLNGLDTLTMGCTFWVDGLTMLSLGLTLKLTLGKTKSE